MCNVYYVDFPTKVHEMVTLNEDGSYSIFINGRLSHAAQLKAYKHALNHIRNDDFYKPIDELNKFEREADNVD